MLKWRWYHRPRRPWNLARLHLELARRQAFARGAMRGNPLQMLRAGRLEIGPHAYFEPGVWITSDSGRISIGGALSSISTSWWPRSCGSRSGNTALHAGERLPDHRRRSPLRRLRQAGPVAGLHHQRSGRHRRQRVAGRQRRGHERRDDRPAGGDRRELGRDRRHSGVLDRRRCACPGAPAGCGQVSRWASGPRPAVVRFRA